MTTTHTGIPMEIVAAITATIATVMDQTVGGFAITAIRPEATLTGAVPGLWAKAGLLESHLLRRQFGLRSR